MNIYFNKIANIKGAVCIFLCICALSTKGLSQTENIWVFGRRNAGLDFNNGPPSPFPSALEGFGEAAASVCNENGQLLFYTEGSIVWDRNHNVMPNGTNLTGLGVLNVTSSCSQGAQIVPMPDSPNKYYIFSLTAYENQSEAYRLYYSIVNMDLNNGMGDIEYNSKGILVDSNFLEKMTAVVGDRCNIWLLLRAPNVGIKAFEITADGINNNPVISPIGNFPASFQTGKLVSSPNREKLIETATNVSLAAGNGFGLYDFDPVTGTLSNFMHFNIGISTYGACFSPDNTKAYIHNVTLNACIQFDISSNNQSLINSSPINLGYLNGALKLGPDKKIYGVNRSCIHFPNLAGTAAQFGYNSFALAQGAALHLGLSNDVPVYKKDTLIVSMYDSFKCYATALYLQASDTSGWDYLWNDGTLGVQKQVFTSGIYSVSYHTSPCVLHTDTFHVYVLSGPVPAINISPACKGDTNGLVWAQPTVGDSTVYSYRWRANTDTTILSHTDSLTNVPKGHYQVHITTLSGCDTTLHFYIPEEDYNVSFAVDTIICEGDTVVFENTSEPHFDTWRWHFGNNDSSSLANFIPYRYDSPGSYTVRLIGQGPICTDTTYKTIAVDAPVSGPAFLTDRDSICTGDYILFTPLTSPMTTELQWDWGDGGWSLTPNEVIQYAYEDAGTMIVTLTARFRACPVIRYTGTVYMHPVPKVDLGPDSFLCLNGGPVYLSNHAINPPGYYRYEWNTGDTTTILKVVHQGSYRLRLTNVHGCTGTEQVTIDKDCYIDIPNAFTPNGDGINDYFFPRQLLSGSVARFRMSIFNRWGQKIFETTNTEGRGWDGRFNGRDQPTGVYVYAIDLVLANGRAEQYTGNVSLLR